MKRGRPTSKLRLFKQEKLYTCAVACLRMVLDSLNLEIDEPNLAALCHTDPFGTSADDLARVANELGFQGRKEFSNMSDLQKHLTEGIFPILYVNLLSIDGLDMTHAVVLEAIARRRSVTVLDPWHGRRTIPFHQFKVAREKTRYLAVLVRKR